MDYGWKLHLACVVAQVWIPVAAQLTPADTDDGHVGQQMLAEAPLEVRFVLGDQHYNRDELRSDCHLRGCELVTPRGASTRTPTAAAWRCGASFIKLRSVAMENLNEHFKGIFDGHGPVPTKGRKATARFALGAVLVYGGALVSFRTRA